MEQRILLALVLVLVGGFSRRAIGRKQTLELSPEQRAAAVAATHPITRLQLPALGLVVLAGYLSKSPLIVGALLLVYIVGFGVSHYSRLARLGFGADYMRSRRAALAVEWIFVGAALAILFIPWASSA